MVGKYSRFSVYVSYIMIPLYGWDLSHPIWLGSDPELVSMYLTSLYPYMVGIYYSLYGWEVIQISWLCILYLYIPIWLGFITPYMVGK